MERKSSAYRRAIARLPDDPPGIASDYLDQFAELVRTGALMAVVLYRRVSGRAQRAHLDDQESGLRFWMDEFGVGVVETFAEVASGWRTGERPCLDAAIEAARANGPGTVVVAGSTGPAAAPLPLAAPSENSRGFEGRAPKSEHTPVSP